MSHLLQVWESPWPATLAEAIAIRDRLLREKAPPSPRCRELAARLTARFPDIDTSGDAEEDDVWTDGPLAGNADAPVFGISVRMHATDTVVPFIIEAALQLGLVVLDEESAQVHVPGTPRQRQRLAPAPAAEAPLRKAEVQATLAAALGPSAAAAGFKPLPRAEGFRRVTPGATFELWFQPEAGGNGYEVGVTTELIIPGADRHPLLDQLYPNNTSMLLNHPPIVTEFGAPWPGADDGPNCRTYVKTRAELQAVAQRWAYLYEAVVWPLLERCATLKGLEREVHEHRSAFCLRPVALALAVAVGRSDLNAVAADVRRAVQPTLQPGVDRLLARIRDLGYWVA